MLVSENRLDLPGVRPRIQYAREAASALEGVTFPSIGVRSIEEETDERNGVDGDSSRPPVAKVSSFFMFEAFSDISPASRID